MTIQIISGCKSRFIILDYSFFTDILAKPIWGDTGEDTTSIISTVMENTWHLYLIRIQSGEPYPLSDTVRNVIGEYEKDLTNEEVFEPLVYHNVLKEFGDVVLKF